MLLKPKQGEKKEDYVARFVADKDMLELYPESSARKSVAEVHYDNMFDKKEFAKNNSTVKEAEIFSVGKWNELHFNTQDLENIVKAFDSLSEFHKVPLKLGHNTEQQITDGQPAIGWVDDLWVKGNKLMARFVDVPKIVMDAIEKKLYRTVSVELLRGVKFKGKNFSNVLDAVALLGADIPAVGNLADLKKLMSREELTSEGMLCFSAINGNLKEESTMTPEEEAKLRSQLAIAEAAKITAEAQVTVANAKVETFAAADKARAEADDKAKVDFARKTVQDTLEDAVKGKIITPAQRDLFERTLNVADDAAVINIDIADVKALIGEDKLKDFKADQSSSQGDTEESKEAEDSGLDLSDKAYAYMDSNPGVSFERAVEAVMQSNRKLATKYMNSNGVRKDVA